MKARGALSDKRARARLTRIEQLDARLTRDRRARSEAGERAQGGRRLGRAAPRAAPAPAGLDAADDGDARDEGRMTTPARAGSRAGLVVRSRASDRLFVTREGGG